MSSDPSHKEGQYPPSHSHSHWDSQPPRGAYPLPQQALNYRAPPTSQPYPSLSVAATPADMVTLPPPQIQPHPDLYRHPPYDMYPGHPTDPHRGGPQQHMNYNQPAPRQRTAIACRYCRRRKIRCSGFEASDDGRCTNCQRFQQECIFTPVSSQAQAFVPAHTAYPHLRNSGGMSAQRGGRSMYTQPGQPAIYGAHGQPLGPLQDPNYPPPAPHGYPIPSPSHPYPTPYDDRGPQHPYPKETVSRKRPRSDEPFHPAVPPPPQEPSSHPHLVQGRPSGSGRRGSGSYEYPEPTPLVPLSPSSSVTSYQSAPYPPPNQPYYAAQQRRASPQSAYSYDPRNSGSPHGSTSSASNYPYPAGLHPPQALPPRESGHTPPPAPGREGNGGNGGNGSGQRGAMSVRDLLGPEGQAGRSSADSDMVKALNRRGM